MSECSYTLRRVFVPLSQMMLQPCFMKMMKVLTDRVTQTYDYVIEIDF